MKRYKQGQLNTAARTNAILDTVADGIVTINEDGILQSLNLAAERMFGYEAQEILGKNISILMPEAYYRKEEKKLVGIDSEVTGKRKNGSHFSIELCISSFEESGHNMLVCSIRDITEKKQLLEAKQEQEENNQWLLQKELEERKKVEQELTATFDNLVKTHQELQKQLDLKNQMEQKMIQAQKMESLGTLAGGIAHDFNNILWMIIGNSEMLQEQLQDQPELFETQQDISMAAERAKGLIQQLLDFSRHDSGKQDKQAVVVSTIVEEVAKMVSNIIPATIELKVDIEKSNQSVFANPTKIHQIIMNLCTNAYQSMLEQNGTGTLYLGLRAVQVTESNLREHVNVQYPGNYLVIEVKDTGCGIAPEILPRIFDPFFTTKEVGAGTGLGLATLHGIVSDMDGAVNVDSTVGKGTTFRVYLSIQTDIAIALPKLGSNAKMTSTDGTTHILLVDDEQMIRQMLLKMLTRLDYQVSSFSNGEEALKAFEADPEKYDLVITDQTMPRLTGLDMAKKILSQCPNKPIILVTGYRSVIPEEEMNLVNITKVMDKPLELKDLTKTVESILKKG